MQTVYEFELPRGLMDAKGELHRKGKMRLATAGDELRAARDPRVIGNPAYLTMVVLSYVITELEGFSAVTATDLERLFTADLAFLQDMYDTINEAEPGARRAVCPACGKEFELPVNFTQEA